MLVFLADLPLNGSAYTADSGVDTGALQDYNYALFVRSIYDYYVPILIVGGLLCNVVSIVVFASNNVGGGNSEDHTAPSSSSSLYADDSYDTYLSSRAVADTAFLLCLFVVWLDTVNVPMYTTAGWCQAVTYVSLVTSFLTVWLTTVASVDRAAVLCVGARTSFSSRMRARFVCVGLLWFALPVYLNISILIDVAETYVGPVCAELPDYYDMMQVISRVETVVNVVVPWIVVICANILSIVRLLDTTCRSSNQGTAAQPEVVIGSSERDYIRSTSIAQLCASMTCMLLGLPAHGHQLYVMLAGSHSAPVGLETYMTQRLLLVVLYSRCASTFFVHVVANRCFGRRFFAIVLGAVRRRSECCDHSTAAAAAIDMSLSSTAPTWSPGANGDHVPTHGDTRAVVTTSLED